MKGEETTPATPAVEDAGQALVRKLIPHIDQLGDKLSARGPEIAWQAALGDEAAAAELKVIVARLRHYAELREKLLADPGLSPEFVASNSDGAQVTLRA